MRIIGFSITVVLMLQLFSPSAIGEGQVVKGDFDRSIAVDEPFSRVISLTPSVTEDIFLLGAGDSLVGVTVYCDYPPEAKNKPNVGDIVRPNIELIIAQKPDLVLSAGNAQQVLDKVQEFGIPCLSFKSESIADIKNDIFRLGILLGKEQAAKAILKDMTDVVSKVQRVTCDLKSRKALLAFDLDPIIAGGGRTLGNEILSLAGYENIALQARSMYPTLSMEFIVQQEPEFFFYAGEGTKDQTDQLRQRWAEWKSVPAVADERIFSVSADLVSRASPRIMKGLQQLNDILLQEIKRKESIKEQ